MIIKLVINSFLLIDAIQNQAHFSNVILNEVVLASFYVYTILKFSDEYSSDYAGRLSLHR